MGSTPLVVTSRLHYALPCLAFGTPVIFVHENLKDPRIIDYTKYLKGYSLEEFKDRFREIDWENSKPNPNLKEIEKIRERLVKTCEAFINKDL